MTFAPNALGFYDLAGNVREWCADWMDGARKERVVRGSCWKTSTPVWLLSSRRIGTKPIAHYSNYGFRCVLEVASPQPKVTLPPVAQTTTTPLPTPALPTGPTTWTDTKGRSITATFKTVESGNVLLDIAGKVTPVPLNTLSAESQKLARDLEMAMPKAHATTSGAIMSAEVKPQASLMKSGWRSLLDECPDAFARLRLQDVGNGWKKFRSGGFGSLPLIEAPDAAIRMRSIGPMFLIVRWREDGDGSHGFKVSVQSSNGEPRIIGGIISAIDEKGRTEWRPIRASELNFPPDEEYLLELRAYGKKIDVLVNGDVKYRASNVDLAGTWLALRGIPANCTFKDLEWMPLDANGTELTLSGPSSANQ